MSKLDRFFGKPLVISALGKEDFGISPLAMNDFGTVMKLQKEGAQREAAIQELMTKAIKQNFPEVTNAEILSIQLTHLEPIISGILKVNGLVEEDATPEKIRE